MATTEEQRWSLLRKNVETRTSITMNRCNITFVPQIIAAFSKLKKLTLRDNRLVSLPVEIGSLAGLEVLSLGNNNLTGLPDSLAKLKKLQKLHLFNNELTALPGDVVAGMTSLTQLNVNHNALTELPPELGQLKKLASLTATNNQLTELPAAIGGCSSLKELTLTANSLRTLPDSLWKLSQLKAIVLIDNALAEIPDCVMAMKSLQELDVSMNFIEAFSIEIIEWSAGIQAFHYDANTFLEVVTVDELPAAFKTPRFPSLLELAARVLSHNKPSPDEWAGLGQSRASQIRDAFPAELRHEVMASRDCPVCGTPAVTEYLEVIQFVPMGRADAKVPTPARLCSAKCLIAKRRKFFPTLKTIQQKKSPGFRDREADDRGAADTVQEAHAAGPPHVVANPSRVLQDAMSAMSLPAHWSRT